MHNFDVKKFFDHYEPFFFDTNYYRENPNDGKANYTSDHPKIRDQLLIEKDFCCESCGVQLKEKTSLLHMHHLNSRKGDNQRDNLKLLCIICHSLQPNHHHMKHLVKSADAVFIRQRLAKQKAKKWRNKKTELEVIFNCPVFRAMPSVSPSPTWGRFSYSWQNKILFFPYKAVCWIHIRLHS